MKICIQFKIPKKISEVTKYYINNDRPYLSQQDNIIKMLENIV